MTRSRKKKSPKRPVRARSQRRGPAPKRPRTRKRNAPRPYMKGPGGMAMKMADDCAKRYVVTMMNPFDSPAGACIPKFPTFPSRKVRYFAKGFGATGASGNGGICIGQSIANDVAAICTTSAAWVPTGTCALPAPADAGAVNSALNSEYLQAAFVAGASASNAEARLVSCGIRVRYRGKVINAGGSAFSLEEPDHRPINNPVNDIKYLRSYTQCSDNEWDGNWVTCTYCPINPTDFDYWSGVNGQHSSYYFMGIAIQGPEAVSQPFEWEVTSDWEIIGNAVRGTTPSETASGTTERLLAAAHNAPPSVWEEAGQSIGFAIKTVKQIYDFGVALMPPAAAVMQGAQLAIMAA